MQVMFKRWSLTEKDRTAVTVNPARVDSVEWFSDAFAAPSNETYPAASKIVMRNKQEYVVQGAVEDVQTALNEAEAGRARSTVVIEQGQVRRSKG